jgi:hypothetical protein
MPNIDAILQWLQHPTHPILSWTLLVVGVLLVCAIRVYDSHSGRF